MDGDNDRKAWIRSYRIREIEEAGSGLNPSAGLRSQWSAERLNCSLLCPWQYRRRRQKEGGQRPTREDSKDRQSTMFERPSTTLSLV